ncbi:type I DNA topoisomerase [Deferribacter abyssi]|uniref:type I DNA topoisomerase n=1 Tax=Deferribacter abyssi TaxID=213806 RepID=UPI003C1EA795
MSKNLVIVESPAKARTIEKYLGKDFKVMASIGHVKDLPENELGVDVDKDFKPKYKIIKGKKKIIDALKKEAEKSDVVYLAPDPDREGEAIAWHIAEEIKKKNFNIKRVEFHEITKKGISEGISNPKEINLKRVNAQQSRRILDRLVGYLVSPLLWKPLKYGLSAGRVQSVALRLICEREEEIEKFVPKEYHLVDGLFLIGDNSIKARLEKKDGKKFEIPDEETVNKIKEEVLKSAFVVSKVDRKEAKQSAPLPFITSTLQQEAVRKLGFSAKKTMIIAQQLYEGVGLGKEGPVGLITYMRTDSTRISEDAKSEARNYIIDKFGEKYVGNLRIKKSGTKNVQDAHEAIRPTSVLREPELVKEFLSNDQYKLYKLIWERFVASQMAPAKYDRSIIEISDGIYTFVARGKILTFDGFMKLYTEGKDNGDEEGENGLIVDVKVNEKAALKEITSKQMFTTPPPRYTEATLVKTLEQKGIGRPSTYATIISTIVERGYVTIKDKKFYPTELGRIVNSLLISNFPKIFDIKFTANMEKDLDEIEKGKVDWKKVLKDFYINFEKELKKAEDKLVMDLTIDNKCPQCHGDLIIKYGKNGAFVACNNYPECKFTSDFKRNENGQIELVESKKGEDTGIKCEKCGKEMVIKKSRFGEILACSGYPECKNIKNFIKLESGIRVIENNEKIDEKCPECGNDLYIKKGRNGLFIGCSNYPECKFTANFRVNDGKIVPVVIKVDDVECEKCGGKMVLKRGRRGSFFACENYPECKNTKSAITLDDGTITVKN